MGKKGKIPKGHYNDEEIIKYVGRKLYERQVHISPIVRQTPRLNSPNVSTINAASSSSEIVSHDFSLFVDEKDKEIDELKKEISKKNEEIEKKDKEIDELNEDWIDKDTEIQELKFNLNEKDKEIDELKQKLNEKDNEIKQFKSKSHHSISSHKNLIY